MSARKKVLILFDIPEAPVPNEDFRRFLGSMDYEDEHDLRLSLRRLGFEVKLQGVYDSIDPLLATVTDWQPDLVFNQVESFGMQRNLEPSLVGLLDLLGLPYTGAKPDALRLCKDKGHTKKILAYHGLRVPQFLTLPYGGRTPVVPDDFPLPAICKPVGLEASEGITDRSVVHDHASIAKQAQRIHQKYKVDVIVEEFIPGRELYVGIIGNERLTVLPPQELHFGDRARNLPKIASYKVKWDLEYRKRLGIRSGAARLSPKDRKRVLDYSRKVYRHLGISGYARLDLRLTEEGEPVFIEANPNPAIGRTDEFAKAAKVGGMRYDQLVKKIVELARAT